MSEPTKDATGGCLRAEVRLIEILNGTLDMPEAFAPRCHIHDGERLTWFETHDALPRYRVWHDHDDPPYRSGPAEAVNA
ncbi:hypothetical protein [Roseovarius sp. 2305UL8-3]|uniref:hypothetical protein n=1 Tax=Roseovarius conchicola TaxID=3121636 RepID=UPI0035285EB1